MPVTTSSAEARDLYLQGMTKLDNIEFEAAGDFFERAIGKDPDFAMAYVQRALSGGNIDERRKYLDKAVALTDKVSESEAAFILYNQALFDADGMGQKKQMEKLLQLLPNDKRVLDLAGVYYYAFVRDYNQALAYFTKATEVAPDYGPPYNMIGYCQVELKNYDAAEKAFQKYIEFVPNSPNPYDSYAELLLTRGKYDESIKQYQKAYDTDNKFITALLGIGNNHAMKGEFDKAREYFMKVSKEAAYSNTRFNALTAMAGSYVEEGLTADALETCQVRFGMAEEQGLTDFQVSSMNQAGFIACEAGDMDKAKEYYDQAAEIIASGKMTDADRATNKFNAAVNKCYLLTEMSELDEATKQGEQCMQMAEQRQNPNELQNIHGQLGALANKKGEYKKALEHLAKADPQSPYNWYQMAIAYEGQEMKDKAKEYYGKVANQNELRLDLAVVRQKAKIKL